MRVLIHSRTITAEDKELRTRVASALETALGPVQSCLHWIDAYLTDVNGTRGGPDKRCRLVAHLRVGKPVVVTRTDRDPIGAVVAAAARCRRLIRRRLKQRQDRRRRAAVL
jgi:hypothetical protein